MSNGVKDLTFTRFVDRFYEKTRMKGFDMQPRLTYVIKICKNIDKTRDTLKTPLNSFIDEDKIEAVANKIPHGLYVHGANATEFFKKQMGYINREEREDIQKLNDEIVSEIELQLPTFEDDSIFSREYSKWDAKPINKSHIDEVESVIKSIGAEYESLHEEFHTAMNAVKNLKTNNDQLINSIYKSFGNMLAATNENNSAAILKLEILLIKENIRGNFEEWAKHLQEVKKVLKLYNERRVLWVEVLIGMRKTLDSARTSTKKPNLWRLCTCSR